MWLRRAPLKAAAGRGREWTESFEVQSPSGGQRLDGPQDRQGAGCVDLCRGKTAGLDQLSLASPPCGHASCPLRPSPGQTPRSSGSFPPRKCLLPPRPEGRRRGRPPAGAGCTETRPHKARRGCRGAVGAPPRGMEGAQRSQTRVRKEEGCVSPGGTDGWGRSGIRAPRPHPNSEPGIPTVRPGGLWSISIS